MSIISHLLKLAMWLREDQSLHWTLSPVSSSSQWETKLSKVNRLPSTSYLVMFSSVPSCISIILTSQRIISERWSFLAPRHSREPTGSKCETEQPWRCWGILVLLSNVNEPHAKFQPYVSTGDITMEGLDKERQLQTGEIIIIVVVLLMWAGEFSWVLWI